ncbi:hypothetical protein [Halorubrum sp. BOL3-1]|nr:hypothetical protein [Halorubrum sp. BOL3-1]
MTQIWGGWSPVVAGFGWGIASFIGFVTHLAQDGLLDLARGDG